LNIYENFEAAMAEAFLSKYYANLISICISRSKHQEDTCPILYEIIRKRESEMSSGLYSDSSLLSEIVFPKLEAIVDAERPICQTPQAD
jgi:hypothetical protein